MVASNPVLAVSLSALASLTSTFDAQAKTNVAVYYGQGANQQRLSHFCQETSLDIINLAFLNIFPDQGLGGLPGTNFGNQCDGLTYTVGNTTTELLSGCHQLIQDIPICQAAGKKVLLSLGGGYPDTQKIESETSAIAFADYLWAAFGPVSEEWSLINGQRPFGDVVIDGFDFDIEHNGGFGYDIMVNRLREHFTESSQSFYISASPQCPIPDAQLSNAIANSAFDFVWVQFYNNDGCSARNFVNGTSFNYEEWVTVIKNGGNPDAKLFVGLPASSNAANKGYYITPDEAQPLIKKYMDLYPETFGGVMLWEATQSDLNQINGGSYADNMKSILNGCAPKPSHTPTPSPSSTPASSSTPVSSSTAIQSSVPFSSGTPSSSNAATPSSSATPIKSHTPAPSSSPAASSSGVSSSPSMPSPSSSPVSSVKPSPSSPVASGKPTQSSSAVTSPQPTASSSLATSGKPTPSSNAVVSSKPVTSSSIVAPNKPSSSSSAIISSKPTQSSTAAGSSKPTTSSSLITSGNPSTSKSSVAKTPSSGVIKPSTPPFSFGNSSSTAKPTFGHTGSAGVSASQTTLTASSTGSSGSSGQSSGNTKSTSPTVTSLITPGPSSATSTGSAQPDTVTTIIITSYIDICPTGFTTITTTYTTTYCPGTGSATATATNPPTGPVVTTSPSIPEGWTTTVTVCTHCAPTSTTVTLTLPPTATEVGPASTESSSTLLVGYPSSLLVGQRSSLSQDISNPSTPLASTSKVVIVPTTQVSAGFPQITGTGDAYPSLTFSVKPSQTQSQSQSQSRVPVAPSGTQEGVSPVFTGAGSRTSFGGVAAILMAFMLSAFIML